MKKTFLYLILTLFLAYTLWLSFHLLSFKTYRNPSLEDSPLEVEGVYHIHTQFSDGHETPEKIADLAAKAGLDFIILTDHGRPNLLCLASQGWKKGVLVLAGSELSVSRGHLVGLGFPPPPRPFPQNAEEAVYKINSLDGFTIIAHPYSKVRWSWGEFIDYSGLEIINADTMVKKDSLRWLPYLPALLFKPQLALLKTLKNPEANLRKWDELNSLHPLLGYFSADAHFLYRPLLSLLHLHVELDTPLATEFEAARRQVFEALKRGRFYNAVESAAEARGFGFRGEKNGERIPMGSTASLETPVLLRIKKPFPFASEAVLIHKGLEIYRSKESLISFEATKPGAYRVEVFLRERTPLRKDVPWIVSNPIFLKE